MKIPFQQFFDRISDITVPIAGAASNPPPLEAGVADRLVSFLEDRRVLYEPYEAESVSNCVASVFLIRSRLTSDIESLKPDSELAIILGFMRAACRKFLGRMQQDGLSHTHFYHDLGIGGQMVFGSALGELRAMFGYHLAYICTKYEVNVEEQLTHIFPAPVGNNSSVEEPFF